MLTETVSDPCQLPVLREEAEAGVGKKFVPRTSGELGNSFHWEMAEVETRGAGSGASSGGRCKGRLRMPAKTARDAGVSKYWDKGKVQEPLYARLTGGTSGSVP